ncbi:hypothetical protein [Bradyrhizobium sp. WD16]|uniref:hypothetical protein n=1 Tax=Bradyrhizobium sp. WD16 TaxID=1521768 RepID=UPI0020A42FB3|nr:hypothetical protein [Bradyrhizobium sp. WD16]
MLRRITIMALAGARLMSAAIAEDRPDFARAADLVAAGVRSADSYLRTGNVALAQIEIGEATTAWTKLQRDFGDISPPGYAVPAFRSFVSAGGERLAAATKAIDDGDTSRAASELLSFRQALYGLHHASGLFDLGDCVFELAPAMEALRTAASQFAETQGTSPAGVIATAAVFRDRLQRCNGWASDAIAAQSEFRRLIDGAIAGSGEIGRAAQAGDGALVHRYLIELQSFERLLAFRFG